jgi:hypothetical protein
MSSALPVLKHNTSASPLVDASEELLETRSEWTGTPTELRNAFRKQGM